MVVVLYVLLTAGTALITHCQRTGRRSRAEWSPCPKWGRGAEWQTSLAAVVVVVGSCSSELPQSCETDWLHILFLEPNHPSPPSPLKEVKRSREVTVVHPLAPLDTIQHLPFAISVLLTTLPHPAPSSHLFHSVPGSTIISAQSPYSWSGQHRPWTDYHNRSL